MHVVLIYHNALHTLHIYMLYQSVFCKIKEILFTAVGSVVLRPSCSLKMAELSENYKINGPEFHTFFSSNLPLLYMLNIYNKYPLSCSLL